MRAEAAAATSSCKQAQQAVKKIAALKVIIATATFRRMAALSGGAPKVRVAVFGGAFDPPTVDHVRCCAQILRSRRVDEVWLTPCGPRPDKPNLATPTLKRWAMCEIAVNSALPPTAKVRVCDVDVNRERAYFTYDLLTHLNKTRGDTHEFSFVIGTDWLTKETNIREWESDVSGKRVVTGHKLIEEFDFLVLKRPGHPAYGELSDYGPRFSYLDVDGDSTKFIEGAGSSTDVRNCLKDTHDYDAVAGLVPAAVLAFMRRHRLYIGPAETRIARASSGL